MTDLLPDVLSGYRVLDFGRFIAGPYCAALLGYMGAEVIRIERPGGSEDRFLAPVTDKGDGGLFLQVNCNKKGMTLDISSEQGRAIVKQLVATADVVVANMPPRALTSLGLDYEALTQIKSDIILATNTTYGSHSPDANKIGFDGIAQSMSGGPFFSGFPNQPIKSVVYYVDYSSALSSALGIMAALMMRERTGKGQVVETSLLATALTLGNSPLIEQAVIEANRIPTGNRNQLAAPADIFKTKDGFIIVQVVGPYIYKRWANLMGEEIWLTDPRFQDDISRGNHNDILCERTARWCAERTTADALAELEAARVPCGPVLSYQEVLDHPSVHANGQLHKMDYPGLPRPAPIATAPFRMSDTVIGITHRAPTVGEHTDEILEELGYRASEIAAFSELGIV
ncbi:MAG: CoA transferase [Chloroflexota bacterium]